ncbi:MAG: hypothetical protein ACXVML_17035 [Flavisolibacter sp.]
MRQFLSILLILHISITAKTQLTKGNWLAGGTAGFSSMKNTYSNSNFFQASDVTDINISPNIGYFIMQINLSAMFCKPLMN